jgi:class 3 adenylate cyclase/tetratricopeptide (TPR) repeat protein
VICQACGTENRSDRRFCSQCGSALATRCPSCGAANDPADRFCGNCGIALSGGQGDGQVAVRPATPVSPTAPAPIAERRVVTVLFADLVGFTALSESRDPEETRELLSRYFALSRETLERYGGTIEKFIGDAVMAVWGAPVARENDAELAVRAALELVGAIPRLSEGLAARAGVLTGEAAVTLGAEGEGMVAGDLVNTASRLQSVAPAGSVLVGETTERAASRAIAFEPAGDQLLKGKQSPVPAFRALRVVAELGGQGRSETLEAPFVGRDEELRLLKDLFHATGREKRTRLISVIGPAGIGKSRLAWEFLKYVDGVIELTYWHAGRSPAYGEGVTFWALGEMVRGRCGLLETDDEATTREKLRSTIEQFSADDEERRWIEAALAALLGVGEPLAGGREELFAAWRTFFERIAEQATVVMVFEDLHWADPGLLDFIDHVVDWTRSLPLYIVTLARPELIENRPDWGAGKRNFTSVSLEPLSPAEMTTMLQGMVPGMPHAFGAAIVARADGIPLYAVETVRMLVAQGKLVEEEGAYKPVGDLSSLAVPETLTALISARLDALEPSQRSLLQDAAVLGQTFTNDALSAVSGVAPADLDPALRALVRREVLRLDANPRSPERGQYGFVQSLIREVAYNTLARADRRVRHIAAARYFEGQGSDELAGALARHYLAAYENTPAGAQADTLAVQARLALRGAADRAVALGSPKQALAFFEQAIAVASDPAEEAELRLRAGEAAMFVGSYDVAVGHVQRAIDLRREMGDRSEVVVALTALARVVVIGGPSKAAAILESTMAEFGEVMDQPAGIRLRSQLARAYLLEPAVPRCLALADEVLAAAEHADLVDVIADTLITRGTALAGVWRTREAAGTLRTGIQLAEQHGLTGTVIRGRANEIGMLSGVDPRAAIEAATSAGALARRLGLRGPLSTAIAGFALAAYTAGEWAAALQDIDTYLADEPEGRDLMAVLNPALWIRAARGEDVSADAARVQAMLRATGEHIYATQVHDLGAAVAFAEGRLDDARTEARASNALDPFPDTMQFAVRASLWLRDIEAARNDYAEYTAGGAHGPMVDAQRAVFQAGIAALAGDVSESVRLYREGRRALRDIGVRFMLALSGIDMALLLPAEKETAESASEAREILVELGARPFIDRLDALRESLPGSTARTDSTARTAAPAAAG